MSEAPARAQSSRPYGTGRRKSSVARVWLDTEGTGKFKVNKTHLADYFDRDAWKAQVMAPLMMTDLLGKVDVHCNVKGGGLTGESWVLAVAAMTKRGAVVCSDDSFRSPASDTALTFLFFVVTLRNLTCACVGAGVCFHLALFELGRP